MFKKEWHGYNFLDLILLGCGLIAAIIVSIVFHSQWFVVINTILGTLSVFTQAKGKVITQFISIIYFSFYIYICFLQRFYGEVILYAAIMLPMYIYGIFHWLLNRDKREQVVIVRNNLPKKEWIISSVCFTTLSVAVFSILKALNTAQLVVSTLSFVTTLPAVYLLVRRCVWNQVAFLINEFVVPILWIWLIADGNLALIPMLVCHLFQLIYDIYGVVVWKKLEQKQKSM